MRNFALNLLRSLQQHPPPTLPRGAKQRLQVLDWYRAHGENARVTCPHFCISPDTFSRGKRRFDPHRLSTLECRSHRPRRVRQAIWSPETVQAVLQRRTETPRWGKEKLTLLLHGQGRGRPRCLWWAASLAELIEFIELIELIESEDSSDRRSRRESERPEGSTPRRPERLIESEDSLESERPETLRSKIPQGVE